MQAVILAAGMGKRLKELTSNATKCMVEVNGVTLIERTLTQLEKLNLSRIVIVVGYEAQKLMDYIKTLEIKTPLLYINNTVYDKTNNIYSLYMAKDCLLEEDTLLLESDLIFEEAVIRKLVDNPYPSLALVAKFESWMDGTVVTLDEENNILEFLGKKNFKFEDSEQYYKTVNIYKFSKAFSTTHYVPFLEAYCKALGKNEYYEQVLKVIIFLDKSELKAVRLDQEIWYEIDDIQDLDIAESLFADQTERLRKIQNRYGGYWRYPRLIDFCYLVNPFYPCKQLIAEIQSNFERLLCEYPSGMGVNSLLGAKYFGLLREQVCVGNGAAELIKSILGMITGKIGIVYPTFEEYPNRSDKSDIVAYIPSNEDLAYTADDLMRYFEEKDLTVLTLINPDNPSGNYIDQEDVIRLAAWTKKKGIRLLLDESFLDFADREKAPTLMTPEILKRFSNLIVIKSISKSYGVPGLRLGIVASDDRDLIDRVKKDVSIWNINSFGEFYLQIFEKYRPDYEEALKKFYEVRKRYVEDLKSVAGLRVVPTQANYVMCELTGNLLAQVLTERLLSDYDLLIKDLSGKHGLEGKQYIRVAVKRPEENTQLIKALKAVLQEAGDQDVSGI